MVAVIAKGFILAKDDYLMSAKILRDNKFFVISAPAQEPADLAIFSAEYASVSCLSRWAQPASNRWLDSSQRLSPAAGATG